MSGLCPDRQIPQPPIMVLLPCKCHFLHTVSRIDARCDQQIICSGIWPDNVRIRFPRRFYDRRLQNQLQSDRVIRHPPNSAAIAPCRFRKTIKPYMFCISSSKSGCRSMSFNNFTSGAGGRVSPRSYRENATLPTPNANASLA